MKYFDAVFSYTYTKDLEDKLDLISKNENTEWFSVCEECTQNIKTCSKPITEILKNKYDIDEEHQILFTLNGPVISCKKTNETDNQQYKTIRKDVILDINKLKTGGYTLQDLEETTEKTRFLGKWEDEDIYLKHGKFGFYLEWGSQKKACKIPENINPNEISYEDIPRLLQTRNIENKNILRVLNDNLSIRKGKFGAYIYYKTPTMATPKFFNLKKFEHGFSTCEKETLLEWIEKTYLVG